LRYSRAVADAPEIIDSDRVDAAIAPDGRAIVVWDSPLKSAIVDETNRVIQARMFSASGTPLGGSFVVSEWDHPSNLTITNNARVPRVAWRDDTIAIVWLTPNAPAVLEN
jgi:hypothetical protein